MNTKRTYAALIAVAAFAVLLLTACGGSGGSSESSRQGPRPMQTVSIDTADGVGDVLVDAQGSALYAADQEVGGMVVCVDGCTAIWDPLTVGGGKRPTAGDDLADKLAVAKRPDGARQVTFEGRLLYRFVEDPGPRTVTGNGFSDMFDGRAFTWHVATPDGVSTTSVNSGSSTGGYQY